MKSSSFSTSSSPRLFRTFSLLLFFSSYTPPLCALALHPSCDVQRGCLPCTAAPCHRRHAPLLHRLRPHGISKGSDNYEFSRDAGLFSRWSCVSENCQLFIIVKVKKNTKKKTNPCYKKTLKLSQWKLELQQLEDITDQVNYMKKY